MSSFYSPVELAISRRTRTRPPFFLETKGPSVQISSSLTSDRVAWPKNPPSKPNCLLPAKTVQAQHRNPGVRRPQARADRGHQLLVARKRGRSGAEWGARALFFTAAGLVKTPWVFEDLSGKHRGLSGMPALHKDERAKEKLQRCWEAKVRCLALDSKCLNRVEQAGQILQVKTWIQLKVISLSAMVA